MQEIRHVEIGDVLRARDERAWHQQDMLSRHGCPLISFTMNIAGSVKYDAAIERAFREGQQRIGRELERMHVRVLERLETIAFTGCECLWTVQGEAGEIKRRMCLIEEADELGRLFDIDVLGADGSHLTRNEERRCLICSGPVRACARSRAHSVEELNARTHQIIRSFFEERWVRRIGEWAQKALLFEAVTTPKPGLVDCANNGSHSDMDLFSFLSSASALRSYFEDCARLGLESADWQRLQHRGRLAEDDMFSAAQANTHKGAIFALGILCCALGRTGMEASLDEICGCAAQAGEYYLSQLKSASSHLTGGECQYRDHGLTGARGEAAGGFHTVRTVSLPALENALAQGKSLNDAGLEALHALMACVQDSNIIRRAGLEGQRWVRESVEHASAAPADMRELDEQFIARRISPGGSADLLAVTYFFHFVLTDSQNGKEAYGRD